MQLHTTAFWFLFILIPYKHKLRSEPTNTLCANQQLKHKHHLRTFTRDLDNPMHENACTKTHLKLSSLYLYPATQSKWERPFEPSTQLTQLIVSGHNWWLDIDHIWNNPWKRDHTSSKDALHLRLFHGSRHLYLSICMCGISLSSKFVYMWFNKDSLAHMAPKLKR